MLAVIQIYPHIFVIISLLRHACLAWLHKKCVFSVVTDWQYFIHQMTRLWGGQNTPNLPACNLFFSCASSSEFESCWTTLHEIWVCHFLSFFSNVT